MSRRPIDWHARRKKMGEGLVRHVHEDSITIQIDGREVPVCREIIPPAWESSESAGYVRVSFGRLVGTGHMPCRFKTDENGRDNDTIINHATTIAVKELLEAARRHLEEARCLECLSEEFSVISSPVDTADIQKPHPSVAQS
jgi:hypothetical protein